MNAAPPGGTSASQRLAAFVERFGDDRLPPAVLHEGKRALLHYFGCALGGVADPAMPPLLELLGDLSGPRRAGVVGTSLRLDELGASFANAVSANVLDFDDTHMPTIIHPAAPVAPPLFALAEQRRASGPALLGAFSLGVEVACRAGTAVHPGQYGRGWHVTATCGVLGAAAASARLYGLDRRRIADAIGIAASQAAGLVENLPTEARNVQIGNAARNGLFAAMLAARGYSAAPSAIEGERGWARAMGDEPRLEALTEGLGDTWELTRNTYKAYPCGIVLAPVIDACLAVRAEQPLDPGAIESVLVRGNPLLLARADRPAVFEERIARLSLQHSAAVALLNGSAGLADYARPMIDRPDVGALRARVGALADSGIPPESAIVRVAMTDGRIVERRVDAAKGSLGRPLGDAEIEAKVRELARFGTPGFDPEPLIAAVWSLDREPDAGRLMRLAVGGGQ